MAKNKISTIKATTNQNYYWENPETEKSVEKLAGFSLSLKDVKEKSDSITLFSYNKPDFVDDDSEKLVVEVVKKEKDGDKYYIRTGLYAGSIINGDVAIEIKPSYGNTLFYRMLNYANNIYVDKSSGVQSDKDKKHSVFPLFEYMFLSNLQKSAILGYPQQYIKKHYHDLKIHGGLDVNSYIRRDIPFTGKISSAKNERQYVQSIIDVLYTALSGCRTEVQKNFPRLAFVTSELKSYYSGRRPSVQTIMLAKSHRSLNNPMFADFRRTLDLAEIVIKKQNLLNRNQESSNKISGYLLDVASLWELYLEKLLRRAFEGEGWSVRAQEELNLYKKTFFARSNYPDIIMEKDDKIVILDAKFKKMNFDGSDVDRADLFQIHSYAGYYREFGKKVVLCGLIYPLSKEIEEDNGKIKEAPLYGLEESETLFIIDGICVKGLKDEDAKDDEDDEANRKKLTAQEDAFIDRLRGYLEAYYE